MRRMMVTLLLCLPAVAGAASQPPAGRWEGSAQIPGRELPLVVDLAQDDAGAWSGSIILTGVGIKGVPLTNIAVSGINIAFDIANALGSPPDAPANFKGHLSSADAISGEMRQAGNVASFALHRVGPAQVETTLRSTPVARELASGWSGEFELGGYPRHVTLTLENHADAGATAKFVIVGKRTTDLPVDLVVQDGDFVRIESAATQVAFEGRVVKGGGEIRGTFEMGSLELPLVLRRTTRSGS